VNRTFAKRLAAIGRLAVLFIIVGVLYAGTEAAFPWLVPFMPLALHRFLPPEVAPLATTSKRQLVPHDYTALLGGSYAQGEGDWRLAANEWINPPFHSADLLFEARAGDVISFGRAGSGSLDAIAGAPIGVLTALNALGRFETLAPPKTALIYFDEGRDLNNNLRDLRSRFAPGFDRARLFDAAYFQQFIRTTVVDQSALMRRAQAVTRRDRLLIPRVAATTVKGLVRPEGDEDGGDPIHPPPGQSVNRARMGDSIVDLPDLLDGPALGFTPEDMRQAVWVFRQALTFMRHEWPATSFVVVYVPSPLACYALDGERVSVQAFEGHGTVFPMTSVRAASDLIAADIRGVSESLGARFVDARPEVRQAAGTQQVHGPEDWKHFNRLGYTALVRAIVNRKPAP